MKKETKKLNIHAILNNARVAICNKCNEEYKTPYLTRNYEGKGLLVDSDVCGNCKEAERLKQILEKR